MHRRAPLASARRKHLHRSAAFTAVAATATVIALSSGIVLHDDAPATTTVAGSVTAGGSAAGAGSGPSRPAPSEVGTPRDAVAVASRSNRVSRSERRTAQDLKKKVALSQESGGQVTHTEALPAPDPRKVARAMLPQFGFSPSQFGCLDALYVSESGWDPHADNPTSTAYGIPQALIGTARRLPADYRTNPVSQVRWGLWYIKNSYGTPCSAWAFKRSHGWY
jgi:hypothetical protein